LKQTIQQIIPIIIIFGFAPLVFVVDLIAEIYHRICFPLYGIKYIFGYQSKYGAFDEFIINPKDANKLEKIVKYLKSDKCKLNGVVKCEDDCIMEANLEID